MKLKLIKVIIVFLTSLKAALSHAHPIEMSLEELKNRKTGCVQGLRSQPHYEALVTMWANSRFPKAKRFSLVPITELGGKIAQKFGYIHIVTIEYEKSEEYFEVYSERCGIIFSVKKLSSEDISELLKIRENTNE